MSTHLGGGEGGVNGIGHVKVYNYAYKITNASIAGQRNEVSVQRRMRTQA